MYKHTNLETGRLNLDILKRIWDDLFMLFQSKQIVQNDKSEYYYHTQIIGKIDSPTDTTKCIDLT